VVAVGAVTWALVAVGSILALLVAVAIAAWLGGRLTVDLGWGRSHHPLGPIEVSIGAPREVAFDVVAGPYLGRTPGALRNELQVLERGSDLVVAAHHTRLRMFTSTTVEAVRFEPPERIAFRLLRGVPPSVVEEFALRATDGGCSIRYSGELAMDFWIAGRLAGRYLVKPIWEGVVRRHLQAVKQAAESRSRSS
jgi:hypothetical protein